MECTVFEEVVNRYKYLTGHERPEYKTDLDIGVHVLPDMDTVVAHGRSLYRAGYTEIYPSDNPKVLRLGWVFSNAEDKAICLETRVGQQTKYLEYFTSERGKMQFIEDIFKS